MKILYLQFCCIVFHFLFQNLFLTNVQGILCHVYSIFFFYSGDYYEHILNLHLLYKQIETYIHKDWDMSRLCQLCVSSIGTLVKG